MLKLAEHLRAIMFEDIRMILERVYEVMEVSPVESGFWLVGGQAERDKSW